MSDPRVDLFNRRAADYEGYSDWCKDRTLFDLCVEPLQDMLPSVECLDLAGGTGWVARRSHAETGRRWTVLDIASEMGRGLSPSIRFVVGDAHHLPFEDARFGHVVARSMLQFVRADDVLKEVWRVLSPRGHLVIAQKVIPEASLDRGWYEKLFSLKNPTGEVLWSETALKEALSERHFRVLRVTDYRERRKVSLERWIAKDGTVPAERLGVIRALIENPPAEVSRTTNQVISNGILEYDRRWVVIYARRETIKAPLTAAVASLLVEQEIDGVRCVLLQRRCKRYEEPDYCGTWELPQGKVERGVPFVETVRRELAEETGLDLVEVCSPSLIESTVDVGGRDFVDVIEPLCVVRVRGGTDFIAAALLVRAEGEPKSPDVDRAYTWVPVHELPARLETELFYPLNRPMLQSYLRTKPA